MSDSTPKPLTNKIDFAVIISVRRANPNGDPLNGNRPRQTYDGYGEISDVCLKRKMRNRLQDMGETIFVQSDDNRADDFRSLHARFDSEQFVKEFKDQQKAKTKSKKRASGQKSLSEEIDIRKKACARWFDVRTFGQVFAFEKNKAQKQVNAADDVADADASEKDSADDEGNTADGNSDAVSIGIRGPVTIQSAFSIKPITPDSIQIVKSVNLETNVKEPDKKGKDTMGMKHRVDKGIYVTYGAINTQLASKTGFSDADSEKIKAALRSLFVNDVSSARPEGSMEVVKVIWWKHNSPCGQYSSAKVHGTLRELLEEKKDGTYDSNKLKEKLAGLVPQELDELEGSGLQP